MTEQEFQEYAISTYQENITYLQNYHPLLANRLLEFEQKLQTQEIKAKFDLNFENSGVDIINLSNMKPLYENKAYEISQALVENINTNISNSCFKSFYQHTYTKEQANQALKKHILAKYLTGNAPIVHFVNENLPKEQIIKYLYKFIIFGVGLGLHIPMIHEKLKSKLYLIVEPSLEIFRLSLLVTNYARLSKQARLILAVEEDEIKFKQSFEDFYSDTFIFNHYFKFFKLSHNFSIYAKTIQNRLVSQDFYLYSYNRTLLSLFRTHNYIMQDYKILNISSKNQNNVFEKPVLFLAAGPSLEKNINFVKNNQDRFIIVAIYAVLPLLEQNNIKVNIVTQYDEQDWQVLNTMEKIKDINFFENTIFLFSSHVNSKLNSYFNKKNIYLFQAMFELKNDFGKLTSPSIGELTYALLLKLGVKYLYLLGLDLAFKDKTQTHIKGHSGASAFNELKKLQDSDEYNYSSRKNTILVKGNFQKTIESTPVFKSSIDCFTIFTKQYKKENVKVFNLSDGAYLYDTKALKIKDLNWETLIKIDENTQEKLKENLNKRSEIAYNQKDFETLNIKISSAKALKKILKKFFSIKTYKRFSDYEENLLLLLEELLSTKNKAFDLRLILRNYCQHNIAHLFHLFYTNNENKNLSFIPQTNKILEIQLNKIINTYMFSLMYCEDKNHFLSKKLSKIVKEYRINDSFDYNKFMDTTFE